MDWVLFALTAISLLAAAGFATVAWRLLREERRRSAARVAALSAAIDGPPAGMPPAGTRVPPAEAGLKAGSYNEEVADAGAMFTTRAGAALQGHPLVKAAVVAVMAIVIIIAVAMNRERPEAMAAAAQQQPAPLELMSMRHTREGTTLTVTGLVRNPPSGVEARRITAVVFVFDRSGGFVASGRAPLDFIVLEPGSESPFVVTVPNVSDVARYRVSFRTEQGVVRHVDRRAEQLQLAQQ